MSNMVKVKVLFMCMIADNRCQERWPWIVFTFVMSWIIIVIFSIATSYYIRMLLTAHMMNLRLTCGNLVLQ